MNRRSVFLVVILAWASTARAELRFGSIFGSEMVLQREAPIRIWGSGAAAGATVNVSFVNRSQSTRADENGNWSVGFDPHSAGGPFTLDASDGAGSARISDVYFGDVWLCSGQSNMQMSLAEADEGAAAAEQAASHRNLRLCSIARAWTDTPQTSVDVAWTTASTKSATHFSAVAYFFADALLTSPKLRDVPLAVVECDMGGTLAEAWAPKDELAKMDPATLHPSMFGIGPSTLYNGMVAPLGPFQFKGVLWYQGEGNAGEPGTYPAKLSALIRGWRNQFRDPDLAFLLIQLPDFTAAWDGFFWQWIRDAQREVADTVPHVGLVTAINTNDGLDLHPRPKREIGRRAALLAREMVYEESVVGRGPKLKSARPQADSMLVTFDTDGSSLNATDPNSVSGFMLASADGRYRSAIARIVSNDSVLVHSEQVAEPRTVRYAWRGVPESSLTNKEGLPAYPARTDVLPPDTFGSQAQPKIRALGAKDYQLAITDDGRINSLVVRDQQLLSNETGISGGVNVPTFFGPTGFGKYHELGPDLYELTGGDVRLTIELRTGGFTWTFHNGANEQRTVRINLSPRVAASETSSGHVKLSRDGVDVDIAGVTKLAGKAGVDAFLEVAIVANSTVKVDFNFEQNQ